MIDMPSSLVQMLDLELHLLAQLLVERAERLVHQQQWRLEDHGARQRNALLLAAGELVRKARPVVRQPDEREHPVHARGDLGGADPAHLEGKRDVLRYRHMREQGVVLEDHADIAPVWRQRVDRLARQQDLSARRLHQPGNHRERGRLAGA